MRPYVTRVVSNLKSDLKDPWEIEIGQKTLIVGSNASHKSSVTQSVELALTGSVDDVVGRTAVKSPDLLLTMVPGDTLTCTATLSTEQVCGYTIKAGKRPKSAAFSQDTLPLRQVREALTGSALTARRAFVQWVAAHISEQDVLDLLPKTLHKRFKQLADEESSAIDNLLHVLDYVSGKQRDAAREAKGAALIVEELEGTLTDVPDEELIATLASQLRQFGKMSHENLNGIDDAISDVRQSIAMWEEASSHHKLPAAAEQLLYLAEADALTECPACASEVGYHHLQNCLSHYQAALLDDSEGPSYEDAKAALASWKDELARLLDLKSQADVLDHYNMISEQYEELLQAKSAWDNITVARRRAEALMSDAEEFKSLKDYCTKAISKLLDSRLEGFVRRVDRFLPSNWTFQIESTNKTFRVGLKTGPGPFRAALSGVEWATVTTAVAMGACEYMGAQRPIVLIPEDRAWDPRTLGHVMRAFSRFDGQVILASTIRPLGRPSKEWTIINLDNTPLFEGAKAEPTTPRKTPKKKKAVTAKAKSEPAVESKAKPTAKPDTTKVDLKAPVKTIRRKAKAKKADLPKPPKALPTRVAEELPRLQ